MMWGWLAGLLCGGPAVADQLNWSNGTAHTLPKGRWEMGVFGPLRLGLKDGVELQFHPGWFFVAPHMAVKKDLVEVGSWNVAFRQSLVYPTPLLRGFSRVGTGGLLPVDAEIPHIFSSDSRVLITKSDQTDYALTFWGEMTLSASIGASNWPTIDFPVGYYQTASYQHVLGLNAGMRISGKAIGKLHYKTAIFMGVIPFAETLWSNSDRTDAALPDATGKWMLTDETTLIYRFTEGFQIEAGFLFRYGDYPYGRNWHVLPTADLVFGW